MLWNSTTLVKQYEVGQGCFLSLLLICHYVFPGKISGSAFEIFFPGKNRKSHQYFEEQLICHFALLAYTSLTSANKNIHKPFTTILSIKLILIISTNKIIRFSHLRNHQYQLKDSSIPSYLQNAKPK